MTYLLDTHAWIQIVCGEKLPPLLVRTLEANKDSLALADISLWEAAKLIELGRLRLSVPFSEFFRRSLAPELIVLPITPTIAEEVTQLQATGFHKDPADQLIVATARVHGLHLISDDSRIRKWGKIPMLWRSFRR